MQTRECGRRQLKSATIERSSVGSIAGETAEEGGRLPACGGIEDPEAG